MNELRYEDAREPTLDSPTDAIVALKAAALNFTDIRSRQGSSGAKRPLPLILGTDGAGVVEQVGAQVRNVKKGDRVCLFPCSGCGACEHCLTERESLCAILRVLGEGSDGTYADYVKLPGANCFPIPTGLSFAEAAAIPSAFVAAWRMLVTDAELKPGESVLILGLADSAAVAALQLAKQLGARVIVAADNAEKLARAEDVGADHGIRAVGDFATEVRALTDKRGVDVVVNCAGGESWLKSFAALAKGGRLVASAVVAGANAPTDLRRIFWNHLKVFGSRLGSREDFRRVLTFLESSGTRPIIDQVVPLNEAAEAQRRLEEGRSFGKIVLQIAD